MTEPDLDQDTRARLAALRQDVTPPAGLEDTVVRAIQAGRPGTGTMPRRRWFELAAAAAATFAAGTWAGARWQNRGGAEAVPAATRFMLLLFEDASFTPLADHAAMVAEYSAWAGQLASRGVVLGGEELDGGGLELAPGASARALASGPGALPAGFFIVAAADEQEAARVAGTCPHLKYGGRVVVRRILPT